MLTKCPACDEQVSKAAPACPQCAHPMSAEATDSERQQRVTTQDEGRATKLHKFLSTLVLIVGGVILVAGASDPVSTTAITLGGFLLVVGWLWYLGAHFGLMAHGLGARE